MALRPPDNSGTPKVSWSDVARRVAASGDRLKDAPRLTNEEKSRILRERARKLALVEEKGSEQGDKITVVQFVLAHEDYAVEASYVREVYQVKDVTFLPGVPPFVVGIVNVRGQILPVMDLKKFFDLPNKGLADLNRLIVLSSEQMEVGVLVDAIAGVRSMPVRELLPSPPTLTGIGEEYLRGIGRDGVIVLDAGKILSDRRIVIHEDI